MFDFIPRHKEGLELRFSGFGREVFAMKEIACAFGSGFVDDGGIGLEQDAGGGGLNDVFGAFAVCLDP